MTMKIIRFSQRGLVGHWRFNEGTGSTAKDSSPFGNNGTIHGASWVRGKFGYALKFDGTDDYVDCGSDDSLNITDAITIEAWIYPKGAGVSTYPRIIDKSSSVSGTAPGYKIYLKSTENYKVYLSAGEAYHVSVSTATLNS